MNDLHPDQNPFLEDARGPTSVSHHGRRFFVCVMLIGVVVLTGVGAGASIWLNDLGAFEVNSSQLEAIKSWKSQDNSIIYDRKGDKIGEFFSSYHIFIPYQSIPKDLINAIIAVEDRNYWKHPGIDYMAVGRAGLAYLRNRGRYTQGASTLTQQVVRHFLLSNEKSLERKVKEISLALQLNREISKERLLEIYLNSMYLGSGAYGVGSAAWRYFGKSIDQLETHESALIAGLFQSPSRLNPHRNPRGAKRRQASVLNAMVVSANLSPKTAKELSKKPLVYQTYQPMRGSNAPYFLDFIKEEAEKLLKDSDSIKNQGLRIYTTLDQELQIIAEEALRKSEPMLDDVSEKTVPKQLANGRWKNRQIESAILVTSASSGEILAMVGGRNYSQSEFNRTTTALRSPGSAFKPIVYSLGLERGKKWSDVIYVAPVTINGHYRPRNSTSDYMTETTLLRAFYRSMNSPTITLGQDLGIDQIVAHAKKLGLYSLVRSESGSALGSSETTMLDLARMYSTFSNRGMKIEQVAITEIKDRNGKQIYLAPTLESRTTRAISPQISYLMTEGMRAVLRYGTGYSASEVSEFAVGKTGTSNQSKDNWFCGYTTDLTAIVWSGTDDFTPVLGTVHGATIALPIWKEFMVKAAVRKRPGPFVVPPGVVRTLVDSSYGSGSEAGVPMWFTEHNLPPSEHSALESLRQNGVYRNVFSQ
jgi:penicillin-binding protein 1A